MSDPPLLQRPALGTHAAAPRAQLAARREAWGRLLKELFTELKTVDFGNAIVVMGATLLLSALPLLILVSSIANQRIDDDLSRHIGLDRKGAHIFEGLFRTSPAHSAGSVALGIVVSVAGATTFVASLQAVYESAFDQERRGWRSLPRSLVWLAVLIAALIAGASYDHPLRAAAGRLVRDAASLLLVFVFLWWTMHFLLAGRVGWRRLIGAAVATTLLWQGLALFSSVYFSSAVISEHKLYGTLGVLLILVTWFIAIAAVLVLGAAVGTVWEKRRRASA
jgi:membrane protein